MNHFWYFFLKILARDTRTGPGLFRWPQKWIKVDCINGNVWFVWINLDFCLLYLLWWMPKGKNTDNLTDYRTHAILYTFQVWFEKPRSNSDIRPAATIKNMIKTTYAFQRFVLTTSSLRSLWWWSEISMCQR